MSLSESQKEYLVQLTPFLEQACHFKNTFSPDSAFIVLNAIKNVQDNAEPENVLKLSDILGVYYQAINVGQTAGCFTLADVGGYYPSYKKLEADIKKANELATTSKATATESEKPKLEEIDDEKAQKIEKVEKLKAELKYALNDLN